MLLLWFTISVIVYGFACMSWWFFFILDTRLPNLWERNCPFGFLRVVFWLWCRRFKCVLLSLCSLGRKVVLGNCIDFWSLPFFLYSLLSYMDKHWINRHFFTFFFLPCAKHILKGSYSKRKEFLPNLNGTLGVKQIAVFPLTRPTQFQTHLCYFLSVKMQNKKSKAPTFNKIHPVLFWGKNRKIKKSFSYLPTNFFSVC